MLSAVEATGARKTSNRIRVAGIVPVIAVDRLPMGFNGLTIPEVLQAHRGMITEKSISDGGFGTDSYCGLERQGGLVGGTDATDATGCATATATTNAA